MATTRWHFICMVVQAVELAELMARYLQASWVVVDVQQ